MASDVDKTGYTSIFTSGTTGRKFKNFKQNGNSFVDSYPIADSYWGRECGSVSIIICGSGYSSKANIADVANKLNNSGTMFVPWLQEYSGANVKEIDSPSQAQLVKLLQDGCVAVVHDPGYSENGHYMAVLDVKKDGSQIYVSNPDMNDNIPNGWNPTSVFFSNGHYLTDCYFVPNEGNVADYSGLNDASSNGSDTTCTGTESGKYYTQLKKTDGLNRIDFMNSNPEIFHRYIREGGEYLKYVGYARAKLNLSYWNLKNTFNKVYEKHGGSLPWAYGKTLGFENIYGASKGAKKTNGGGRFTWPVPEYVQAGVDMWHQLTSTFGSRTNPFDPSQGQQNHNGIDISHSTNTSAKIVAAASGEVILVVDNIPGKTNYASYGNHVIIKHSDGYYTLYGHMAPGSLLVKVGDKVNAGQQIGTMGTTGSSTGNHLHFEISKIEGNISPSEYYSSTRLDPCDFFNEDCSPIGGGSGEALIGETPNISEAEKQKYLAIVDSDIAACNGNYDWGSGNGTWTLGYYKDNDLELTARIINHELNLNDDLVNDEGSVELVKCKALIMKKRVATDGSVYNAIISRGQFFSDPELGPTFNSTPPQWERDLIAAMWNGTEPPPPYFDNDAIYWLGAWDAHVWDDVGQIVGIKYNYGAFWVVLAKNDYTGRTICAPTGSGGVGYSFVSSNRVNGYRDVYY